MRFWPVALGYLIVILSANWLAANYVWPVGLGLKAPARPRAVARLLGSTYALTFAP